MNSLPYQIAQHALADLKTAIYLLLKENSPHEIRNVDIGKLLGINHGHSGKHQDHIPRIILELLAQEGLVEQNSSNKKWKLKTILIANK
jgi:hypothetical protein